MSREIPKWLEMVEVALGIPFVYGTLAVIIVLAAAVAIGRACS
jgi:hypothetical protein